mgnify:CR=1 FL=1
MMSTIPKRVQNVHRRQQRRHLRRQRLPRLRLRLWHAQAQARRRPLPRGDRVRLRGDADCRRARVARGSRRAPPHVARRLARVARVLRGLAHEELLVQRPVAPVRHLLLLAKSSRLD